MNWKQRCDLERGFIGAKRSPYDPILSENPKTGVSLNLPVLNCRPTKICREICYACSGPISFPYACKKAVAVDEWIRQHPIWAAMKAIQEADGTPIRLCGSGDLNPAHMPFLVEIKAQGGRPWGFTRKLDMWKRCWSMHIELMFGIDVSSKHLEDIPPTRLAYMRRPGDPDWSNSVAVTFPLHGPRRDPSKVPVSESDCPAIRRHIKCADCRRCYS